MTELSKAPLLHDSFAISLSVCVPVCLRVCNPVLTILAVVFWLKLCYVNVLNKASKYIGYILNYMP